MNQLISLSKSLGFITTPHPEYQVGRPYAGRLAVNDGALTEQGREIPLG
jgi:hypothetical protein